MSKMMFKMLADFMGLTPEEMQENMNEGMNAVKEGLQLMQNFDMRLARIEKKLGIIDNVSIIEEIDERLEYVENS